MVYKIYEQTSDSTAYRKKNNNKKHSTNMQNKRMLIKIKSYIAENKFYMYFVDLAPYWHI